MQNDMVKRAGLRSEMFRRASSVVRRPLRVGNNGFSLVELLLAVAILIIALVPVMDSITASLQYAKAGKENTILQNYAREKMENVLAMDFINVDSSLDDTVTVLGETVARDVFVEYYDGDGDSTPDPDLKKITVTIEAIKLETLLADF